jgi:hypothetical protein
MSRMRQQGRGSRLPAPWMLRCWWQTTNTAGSGRDSSGPPRPQPPTGCQQNTPKIGSSPWRSPRLGGGTCVQYNRERCTHAPNSIAHRTAMRHRRGRAVGDRRRHRLHHHPHQNLHRRHRRSRPRTAAATAAITSTRRPLSEQLPNLDSAGRSAAVSAGSAASMQRT